MVESFLGIIVVALVGGIVSFSLVLLNKISQINEQGLAMNGRLNHIESRIKTMENRIAQLWIRCEELAKQQYRDTYRIDELKKKENGNK